MDLMKLEAPVVRKMYEAGQIDTNTVRTYTAARKFLHDGSVGDLAPDQMARLWKQGMLTDAHGKVWNKYQDIKEARDVAPGAMNKELYALSQIEGGEGYDKVKADLKGLERPSELLDPVNILIDVATGGATAALRHGTAGVGAKIGMEVGIGLGVSAGMDYTHEKLKSSTLYTMMGGIVGGAGMSVLLQGGRRAIIGAIKGMGESDRRAVQEALVKNPEDPIAKLINGADEKELEVLAKDMENMNPFRLDHPSLPHGVKEAPVKVAKETPEEAAWIVKEFQEEGAGRISRTIQSPKFVGDLTAKIEDLASRSDSPIDLANSVLEQVERSYKDQIDVWRANGQSYKDMHTNAAKHVKDLKTHGITKDGIERLFGNVASDATVMREMAPKMAMYTEFLVQYGKSIDNMIDNAASHAERIKAGEHLKMLAEFQARVNGIRSGSGRLLGVQGARINFDVAGLDKAVLEGLEETEGAALDKILKTFRGGSTKERVRLSNAYRNSNGVLRKVLALEQGSLLWDYKTQLVNLASGVALGGNQLLGRTVGVLTETALKRNPKLLTEFAGMGSGLMAGLKDAFKLDVSKGMKAAPGNPESGRFWNALWNTETPDKLSHGVDIRKIDGSKQPSFWKIPGVNITVGELLFTAPFRGLQAGDAIMRSLAFNSDIYGRVWREAAQNGVDPQKHLEETLSGISKGRRPDLLQSAQKEGEAWTLTTPLGHTGDSMAKFLNTTPGLLVRITQLPFFHIIANIAKYGVVHSPLGLVKRSLTGEIAAMTTRERAEFGTRVAGGTLMLAAGMSLYDDEKLTARRPWKYSGVDRAAGVQGYSLKTDDGQMVDLTRMNPITMPLLFGAGLADANRVLGLYREPDGVSEVDLAEVASVYFWAVAGPVLESSFGTSIRDTAKFVNTLSDQETSTSAAIDKLAAKQIEKFIPRYMDVYHRFQGNPTHMRYAFGLLDTIQRKLDPTKNTVKRNVLYGTPIADVTPTAIVLRTADLKEDEVAREAVRLQIQIRDMNRVVTLQGEEIKLTNKQYGELWDTYDGDGAKQALTELINSPEYQGAANEWERQKEFKKVINAFRKAAREEWLDNNPAILKTLTDELERKAAFGSFKRPTVNVLQEDGPWRTP